PGPWPRGGAAAAMEDGRLAAPVFFGTSPAGEEPGPRVAAWAGGRRPSRPDGVCPARGCAGLRLHAPMGDNGGMAFTDKLRDRWTSGNTLVCVGLDPDINRFPPALADEPDAVFAFCRDIADATAPFACAFKPQIAYFSAHPGGEDALERLMAHLRAAHPQVPVILDAKRGDIGSTAQQYAAEAFDRYGADAVTLNPYMGFDSAEP